MERIKIKDNVYLTVGMYHYDDYTNEMCVVLEDEDGYITQDIAVIRKCEESEEVECLVYGCADVEDYTDKFKIDVREDEYE